MTSRDTLRARAYWDHIYQGSGISQLITYWIFLVVTVICCGFLLPLLLFVSCISKRFVCFFLPFCLLFLDSFSTSQSSKVGITCSKSHCWDPLKGWWDIINDPFLNSGPRGRQQKKSRTPCGEISWNQVEIMKNQSKFPWNQARKSAQPWWSTPVRPSWLGWRRISSDSSWSMGRWWVGGSRTAGVPIESMN